MKTPIVDFVSTYAKSGRTRFHMPGHKGSMMLGCEPIDITEIDGADVLYRAEGIIKDSEQNASKLFGTAQSFYSTEGSSLAIKAMLALVSRGRATGERPLIIAARNAHRAFVYASALLDLDVLWLMPGEAAHLCSCAVTAEDVGEAIQKSDRAPAAVYLTSPDYLGAIADVRAIAKVCHANGVPLLVDNAHGAYLRFLKEDRHPITLGADMCCDSAHKTLPVLTGGAYLHIAKTADPAYCRDAERMLSVFASTSPSYLILQSLDLCNRYLAEEMERELEACVEEVAKAKEAMAASGFFAEESEPLKIVIRANRYGYTGVEMAEHLRGYDVEAEMADGEYLVLMATPQNSKRDYRRLTVAFANLPIREPIELPRDEWRKTARHTDRTLRDAVLGRTERIPAKESEGRVCGAPTVSCPPAIPIVMCGERITAEDVARFARYGIDEVDVIVEE